MPRCCDVAYSELLDFNYAWLRRVVPETPYFTELTSRHDDEVTGGKVNGRGLDAYTERLSAVYQEAAKALKPGQPFVFTFHHNDFRAYAAPVVAVLDAGLVPTRTIACPTEMRGSIHIAKSDSSRLDTVFVLRKPLAAMPKRADLPTLLTEQVEHLGRAGLHLTAGDRRCLAYGLVAEAIVRALRDCWTVSRSVEERMTCVIEELEQRVEAALTAAVAVERTVIVRTPGDLELGAEVASL